MNHLCSLFPGPNHMPMQGPGPGPNQPPNMPSGSMNMPPSSHGSMGGYNHTVPSSQGMPAQSQMNMTQGQPMGNYGPRPNMNMQPNQGNTGRLSVSTWSCCTSLTHFFKVLRHSLRVNPAMVCHRPHDAPAASLPAVQHASWWCRTALPRTTEPNGYDGSGQPREPCHGAEANAALQTPSARYTPQSVSVSCESCAC